MAVESLAIAHCTHSEISDINIGDTEIKISMLADDTTCFISNLDE